MNQFHWVSKIIACLSKFYPIFLLILSLIYILTLIYYIFKLSFYLFWGIILSGCLIYLIRIFRFKIIQPTAPCESPLKVISRAEQVLYGYQIPKTLYQMNQVSFSQFHFESILFDANQIYLVDSFQERGILRGDSECFLLDMLSCYDERSVKRKVKNPILAYRQKCHVFKKFCELYQMTITIQSVLYFPRCRMELNLMPNLDEFYLYQELDIKTFLQNIHSIEIESSHESELPSSIEQVVYFLLSLRYLDYLKRFYTRLSIIQKVSLKNELSIPSQLVFSLLVTSGGYSFQQIESFLSRHQELMEQGMQSLQMKLFDELEGWAITQDDIEFIPFNFTALLFSEGLSLNTTSNHKYHPSTTLNS